jgi:WhiB family transcriptional regulator, redox-sensing transcriptional regulator
MLTDLPDLPGAVCAEVDPELWFPETGSNPRTAKRLCEDCPARQACLQYALEHPVDGVWGGTSVADRKRLAQAQGRRYSVVLTSPLAGPPVSDEALRRRELRAGAA